MWNPFKKSGQKSNSGPKMGMLQKLAMKKLEKMSPEERNKLMQEALKPENQEKILTVMDEMRKSGHVSEEQLKLAKEKLGI